MPETDGTTMIDGPITRWTSAPTRHLQVRGESFAYRDLGVDSGRPPIVLLAHLGATLDEWDPRVVEALAEGRRVIAVDLPGIGSSTGNVPRTIKGMAGAARAFISELGLTRIDLMGFSLGGFVAQQVTLDAPKLVRRLVLAGTGPAGGEGIDRPTGAAYVYLDLLCSPAPTPRSSSSSRAHPTARLQRATTSPGFTNESWIGTPRSP